MVEFKTRPFFSWDRLANTLTILASEGSKLSSGKLVDCFLFSAFERHQKKISITTVRFSNTAQNSVINPAKAQSRGSAHCRPIAAADPKHYLSLVPVCRLEGVHRAIARRARLARSGWVGSSSGIRRWRRSIFITLVRGKEPLDVIRPHEDRTAADSLEIQSASRDRSTARGHRFIPAAIASPPVWWQWDLVVVHQACSYSPQRTAPYGTLRRRMDQGGRARFEKE